MNYSINIQYFAASVNDGRCAEAFDKTIRPRINPEPDREYRTLYLLFFLAAVFWAGAFTPMEPSQVHSLISGISSPYSVMYWR